nr:hypothetical protein [uncultured bacterium]
MQRQTVGVRSEVNATVESPISEEEERQERTEINVLSGFALSIVVALFGLGYLAFGTSGIMLATGLLLIMSLVGGIATGIGIG